MSDHEFTLLGDALWLDFVNTAAEPTSGADKLADQAAYHRWTKAVKLTSEAGGTPFEDALRLRSRLAALAEALSAGRQPPASAIQAVNAALALVEGHHQLIRVNGALRTQFRNARPPSALAAIAASAAATLSEPMGTVRRCAGPDCALYFTDHSPQQNRRWCSFSRCGEKLRVERRRGSRITPVV